MTTYRRFRCSDLLRVASLDPNTTAETTGIYMSIMGRWPGNCIAVRTPGNRIVADGPGGKIMGYALGAIERKKEGLVGNFLYVKYPSKTQNMREAFLSVLEEACDQLYKADEMRISIDDYYHPYTPFLVPLHFGTHTKHEGEMYKVFIRPTMKEKPKYYFTRYRYTGSSEEED